MGPSGSLQASTAHSRVLNTHAHTNPTYLSTLYDTCYDTLTHLFITHVVNPKQTLERLLPMPVTASISLSKHSERLRHMSVTVCKHFSHLQSKKCYHGPSDWESHVRPKLGSELRLPNAGDDR